MQRCLVWLSMQKCCNRKWNDAIGASNIMLVGESFQSRVRREETYIEQDCREDGMTIYNKTVCSYILLLFLLFDCVQR